MNETLRYAAYVKISYLQDVKNDWDQARLNDGSSISRLIVLNTEGALIGELTAIGIVAIAVAFVAGTALSLLVGVSVKAGLFLIAPIGMGIHSYLYYSNCEDPSNRPSRIFFEKVIQTWQNAPS